MQQVRYESAGGRIQFTPGNEIREPRDAQPGIAADVDAPERLEIDADIERERRFPGLEPGESVRVAEPVLVCGTVARADVIRRRKAPGRFRFGG